MMLLNVGLICCFLKKKALVIGYGDVGKGSADSLMQQKNDCRCTEVDPICVCKPALMDIL